MKKTIITSFITAIVVFFVCVVSPAYAENKIIVLVIGSPNMSINGKIHEIDPGRGTKPVIINKTTLVPIRTIVENMNGTIRWDSALRRITISAGGKIIRMTLDDSIVEIKDSTGKNSTSKKLLTAPQSINGRTMLPIRFVTEELGAKVDWDGLTQTITITLGNVVFEALNWTGSWETENGIIILQQSGNNVGTVTNCEYYGKITGTASEKTLTGRWYQDSDNQGDIILTLSDDGKTFVGKFNYRSSANMSETDSISQVYGWYKIVGQR